MISKAFFIRDSGTTIPAVAILLKADSNNQRTVLRHAGYGPARDYVVLFRINETANNVSYDPFEAHEHGGTMFCAHLWIERNFDLLEDGMHLDVQEFREKTGTGDYGWIIQRTVPLKSPIGA